MLSRISVYQNHLKQSDMKHFFLLSTLFCAALFSVPAMAQNKSIVKGDGNVVTQDRSTGSFNEIHTHGSFNVTITDAATNSVKVEAEQNIQDYIIVETEGSELHIRHKKGSNFRPTKDVTIHVSAPALKSIALSGSGNIKSTNTLNGSDKLNIRSSGSGNISLDVETADLNASISGSGNITLEGKTSDFEGSIAGSGNIRAKDMQSANTRIKIAGSGSAEVVASEKLNTNIVGSGDVKYWGNASVESHVAGSGRVRREN